MMTMNEAIRHMRRTAGLHRDWGWYMTHMGSAEYRSMQACRSNMQRNGKVVDTPGQFAARFVLVNAGPDGGSVELA